MSTRDAMLKIEDIISEASKHNESFSICDHGSIAGWIELYNKCKKANVKSIFGIEAYINKHRDRLLEIVKTLQENTALDEKEKKALQIERDSIKKYDHICLLAKNKKGFHNIIQLANLGFVDGFYGKPTITYDELIKYKEGVIVTSACIGGTVNRFILSNEIKLAKEYSLMMKDVFGDDFYLELQFNNIPEQRIVNKYLLALSRKYDIKTCVGSDAHYLHTDWKETHQDLLLLQGKNTIDDVGKRDYNIFWENAKGEIKKKKVDPSKEFRKGTLASDVKIGDKFGKDVIIDVKEVDRVWSFTGDAAYLSEKELREYAKKYHKEVPSKMLDDIFQGNYEIYDKIENIEIDTTIKLPTIENAEKVLMEKVKQGLISKGLHKKKEYIERAKMELKVIRDNGFSTYFLILEDFLTWATNNSLPRGTGRGSAVSSLVAYVLDIHRIDPLDKRWNGMPFERFLSTERNKNKIKITLEDGKTAEFYEDREIKIIRDDEEMIVEGKELKDTDEFIEVCDD